MALGSLQNTVAAPAFLVSTKEEGRTALGKPLDAISAGHFIIFFKMSFQDDLRKGIL